MSDVANWLARPSALALGWALVHFVWQGAAVAATLGLVRVATRRASAGVRYATACAALAAMAALPVATFVVVRDAAPQRSPLATVSATDVSPVAAQGDVVAINGPAPAPTFAWDRAKLEAAMPWLVGVWLAGVVFLSLRFAAALVVTRRLRRATRPAAESWQRACSELAARLGVRQTVRLCESALAEVPSVLGWLRPVVLVPVGVFVGLDPRQVEAIIAHELAHVRRLDYLVNLLQTAVETLLFYHPAVWWVSRQIREEREHCCDDLAVAACGDVLAYASALADLEDLRAGAPELALAATGGSLVRRIERLLGRSPARNAAPAVAACALAVAAVAATLAGAGAAAAPAPQVEAPPAPPVALAPPIPPAPATRVVPAPSAPGALPGTEMVPPQPPPPSEPPPPEWYAQDDERDAAAASEYAAVGYPSLTHAQLDAFLWQGVTPDYIRELAAVGYTGISPDNLVAMRVQDVDAEYIGSLQAVGYSHIGVEELISMRIQGVDADFVREMRELGFDKLSPDSLVAMRIQGVSPDYVRAMRELGYADLGADDLVAGRVQGVTASYVRDMASLGVKDVSFDELIAMRVQGVTASYVRDVQALGYSPTSGELVAMRVQGVTVKFIKTVIERDGKVSIDRLIEMRVNGEH